MSEYSYALGCKRFWLLMKRLLPVGLLPRPALRLHTQTMTFPIQSRGQLSGDDCLILCVSFLAHSYPSPLYPHDHGVTS